MRRPEELPVLIAEIDDEIFKLRSLVQKLAEQQGKLTTEEMVESAALRLHNFYTGCERIFKLIANDINGTVPETIDWHKRLLTQMALDVTDVRPAVVSKDTRSERTLRCSRASWRSRSFTDDQGERELRLQLDPGQRLRFSARRGVRVAPRHEVARQRSSLSAGPVTRKPST